MKLFSKNSNLYDNDTSTLQMDRQTIGRTTSINLQSGPREDIDGTKYQPPIYSLKYFYSFYGRIFQFYFFFFNFLAEAARYESSYRRTVHHATALVFGALVRGEAVKVTHQLKNYNDVPIRQ